MLELICEERFPVDGVPVDHSSYHNHGRRLGTTAVAGASAGRTAISFPTATSRVSIARDPEPPAYHPQWTPLVALRGEAVVKVDPHAALVLTMIEGHGSFRFEINDQALEVAFDGPPGAALHVRSDEAHAPDGLFHKVPANQWVTVGFDHNGYTEAQLSIEGVVVGRAAVTSGVPPVQSAGVSIGNRVGGGHPFLGAIDRVRVWRANPDDIRQEFWCRPFSKRSADCWEAYFRAVVDWTARHPADLATLRAAIEAQWRAILRGLWTLPEAQQQEIRKILDELMKLWCAGHLHSQRMEDVLRQLVAAIDRAGLGSQLRPTADIERLTGRAHLTLPADCDPAVHGFLQLLDRAIGGH